MSHDDDQVVWVDPTLTGIHGSDTRGPHHGGTSLGALDHNRTHHAKQQAQPRVSSLSLANLGLTSLQSVGGLLSPANAQLVTLNLHMNRLTNESLLLPPAPGDSSSCVPVFSFFPSLTDLNLSSNELTQLPDVAIYKSCPRLQVLDLSANRISIVEDAATTFELEEGATLSPMQGAGRAPVPVKLVGIGLASCPQLRRLFLKYNKIQSLTWLANLVSGPESNRHPLKLTHLDLQCNEIFDLEDLDSLASLSKSLIDVTLGMANSSGPHSSMLLLENKCTQLSGYKQHVTRLLPNLERLDGVGCGAKWKLDNSRGAAIPVHPETDQPHHIPNVVYHSPQPSQKVNPHAGRTHGQDQAHSLSTSVVSSVYPPQAPPIRSTTKKISRGTLTDTMETTTQGARATRVISCQTDDVFGQLERQRGMERVATEERAATELNRFKRQLDRELTLKLEDRVSDIENRYHAERQAKEGEWEQSIEAVAKHHQEEGLRQLSSLKAEHGKEIATMNIKYEELRVQSDLDRRRAQEIVSALQQQERNLRAQAQAELTKAQQEIIALNGIQNQFSHLLAERSNAFDTSERAAARCQHQVNELKVQLEELGSENTSLAMKMDQLHSNSKKSQVETAAESQQVRRLHEGELANMEEKLRHKSATVEQLMLQQAQSKETVKEHAEQLALITVDAQRRQLSHQIELSEQEQRLDLERGATREVTGMLFEHTALVSHSLASLWALHTKCPDYESRLQQAQASLSSSNEQNATLKKLVSMYDEKERNNAAAVPSAVSTQQQTDVVGCDACLRLSHEKGQLLQKVQSLERQLQEGQDRFFELQQKQQRAIPTQIRVEDFQHEQEKQHERYLELEKENSALERTIWNLKEDMLRKDAELQDKDRKIKELDQDALAKIEDQRSQLNKQHDTNEHLKSLLESERGHFQQTSQQFALGEQRMRFAYDHVVSTLEQMKGHLEHMKQRETTWSTERTEIVEQKAKCESELEKLRQVNIALLQK